MDTGARPEPELVHGPLRDGDEEGISELITRMGGNQGGLRLRSKSPDYYRWMYRENPVGPAFVHTVRTEERIVASMAIAPKLFDADGARVVVGKTMDMFTDPDWQGRGLIGACAREITARASGAGLPGWYVTPSVNSYPIFTGRWGYDEPFSLHYRLRVLLPVARPRWRGAGLEVESVDRFGGDADALWEEVAAHYLVAQVRDARYLNWRYAANPDRYDKLEVRRRGRLVGVVVLAHTVRRGIDVGEVMELTCDPTDDRLLKQLVRVASDAARGQGCRLLQTWSIPGTRQDRRLRRAGFRFRRGEVKFLISPGFPGAASRDPDGWWLTQGDGNDV